MKFWRPVRVWLSISLLATSAVLLYFAYRPIGLEKQTVSLGSIQAAEPQFKSQPAAQPRHGTLQWTRLVRAGDAIKVELQLDPVSNLAAESGESITAVEARLELADIWIEPRQSVVERVRPELPSVFRWTLVPTKSGKFGGTLWVYLHDQDEAWAVLARPVELESYALGVIPWKVWRVFGFAGLTLACVLGLSVLQWRVFPEN